MDRSFSFSPVIMFHHARLKGSTPYNLLPFDLAVHDYKFKIIASIPFFSYGDVAGRNNGIVKIEVIHGPEHLGLGLRYLQDSLRSVILWSTTETIRELTDLVKEILRTNAFFTFLIITATPGVKTAIDALIATEKRATCILITFGNNPSFEKATQSIWTAYIGLLAEMEKLAGIQMAISLPPNRFEGQTLQSLYQSALQHSLSPAAIPISETPLHEDYIQYPNAIILNHWKYKVPAWNLDALPPDIALDQSVALAREIRERRLLNVFMDDVFELCFSDPQKQFSIQDLIRKFPMFELMPPSFQHKVEPLLNPTLPANLREKTIQEIHETYPRDFFHQFSIRQFILTCPSYPFTFQEISELLYPVYPEWVATVNRDAEYAAHVYHEMIKAGRVKTIPEPQNEAQEKILDAIGSTGRAEGNFLSALSTLFATRFGCPVFRTHRAGNNIFQLFHKVDDGLATLNDQISDEKVDSSPLLRQIEKDMQVLSDKTTELIDPKMLEEIFSEEGIPMLFTFSDIPLDFVKINGDYLGYLSNITRMPVTPAWLPYKFFKDSEQTTQLKNDNTKTVIITPFEKGSRERNILEFILEQFSFAGAVTIVDIATKVDLALYVDHNDIDCLIYFGHGGIDRSRMISWIQLKDDIFYSADANEWNKIPPVVVLIGCNTSSGGSTLSGMDIQFLARGAQVVATTFPIPTSLAAMFLGLFLSNFLSPGVNTAYGPIAYSDLAEIVSIAKRRMRIHSVLQNLLDGGTIDLETMSNITDRFGELFEQLEDEHKGYDNNFMIALKTVLLEWELIPNANTPLSEIELIPYTLFFTCLGFTWNTRTKRYL